MVKRGAKRPAEGHGQGGWGINLGRVMKTGEGHGQGGWGINLGRVMKTGDDG